MKDITSLVAICRSQAALGKNKESILKLLRIEGCSKVESMAIYARAFAVSLAEAKEVVHLSETWADVRARDERFQERLDP